MTNGLRIERRFTEHGIDPYETVTWTRRDSRITNPDGSTVFEMKDAEVPEDWSQVATDIIVSKYFRKAGVPQVDDGGAPLLDENGEPVLGPERSARQVFDRLAGTWRHWGERNGYFATPEDAIAFEDELRYMLARQIGSPNSPQWFNTGLHWAYGLTGPAQGFWYVDPETEEAVPSPDSYTRPSPHACFILSVDDDLVNPGGIMDLWLREARIFKFGSGVGENFSRIRAEGEPLSGGGKSSGLMSFLKIGDRAAGAIKSGGTTRRAAKMVILDVDHPDIEAFIDWKKVEEDKARLLIRHAGFPADFNGEAYQTVSGQNSNNSVRVPNEFVAAVIQDEDWDLVERTTGKVRKTAKARDLWRRIADAAWACADPGVQFDTTINEWHTSPAGGRIRASNPCFTGETRVATDKGLVQIRDLVKRSAAGETFEVYTHNATNSENPCESIRLSAPSQIMVTGTNEILRLEFSDGRVLRCTPNHRLWTVDRGWVRADELTEDDRVRLLDRPIDLGMASWAIPVSTDPTSYVKWSARRYDVELPEKWNEDLAHYLGWLVGHGCITEKAAVTVYGTAAEQEKAMLAHRQLLTRLNGGFEPKPTRMANGTYQLRVTRLAITRFFAALGVSDARSTDKRIPWSIFEAPKPIVGAFLRGLYDADGRAHYGTKNRYVGLGSASTDLLRDVQQILEAFGVHGSIYSPRKHSREAFAHRTLDGQDHTYVAAPGYDLRISGTDLGRFARGVGFGLSTKNDTLGRMLSERTRYQTRHWVKLRHRTTDGWETTYNLTEPVNHSYMAGGILVSNCSEYLFLDNTACNLASLNLGAFYDDSTGEFDIEAYRHAIRIWTIVLEISVTMAHFPSQAVAEGSYDYRTLGLGYANLGSLLMRSGIPYDSEEGRAIAGCLTAILTGESYATSAEMAAVLGPFPKFVQNREPMLRVMRNHRRAAYDALLSDYEGVSHHVVGIDEDAAPEPLLKAAREAWDRAVELGERHGYRNAQSTVIAPTGCLIGGSLVPTERGLVRLASLGDPEAERWQPLNIEVGSDEGPREATQFYVNGVEPVVTVETARGYRIQGTPTHRVKVVQPDQTWAWKRLADLKEGDLVPLAMKQLIGRPQEVLLPPLPDAYWTSDYATQVPRSMNPDLAEFIGYFMGDGSLHAKGIRLCVPKDDFDVVDRLGQLGKQLFGLEAHITEKRGYAEVAFHSVRLVLWWEACGFAKRLPSAGHGGKGYLPHIPDAILYSNDPEVYGSFLRGLFEADGTVHPVGHPVWSSTSLDFSRDVQNLLLALGFPTTRKTDRAGWGQSDLAVLRLLNLSYNERWLEHVGFIGSRKGSALPLSKAEQSSRRDHVPLSRVLIDRLAHDNDGLWKAMLLSHRRNEGLVSRHSAEQLLARSADPELSHLLSFFYDRVVRADLGEEEFTYDLSVPENLTYLANGFVSHNTIGLQMDCDTTGVEPDFALVKFKKLAGGGYFKIVNQSVAPALERLGYESAQIDEIVDYVVGTMTLLGAPHINRKSLTELGFAAEDLRKVEETLPGVFELKHAFSVFVVGSAALERLGFKEEQYTSLDFDLLGEFGFTKQQIREATDVICGRQTIEGAPGLKEEHLAVFDCANRNGRYGERFIHHTGHIKMMASVQPFISGSISKTINMPSETTPTEIEESYMMSWELGLKSMALYRDGSKASQVLHSTIDEADEAEEQDAVDLALEPQRALAWGEIPAGISPTQAYASGMKPPRFLLPARRGGWTEEARIGGHKVFLRTGEYEDGTLGEVFIDLAKEGATLRGVLSCFAIAISKGLQFGVPLEEFIDTFTFQTFEPRGLVEGHPNIKMANSIIDYVFRALALTYQGRTDLVQVPPQQGDFPEPPSGLALDAGIQLDLTDSAMEVDIEAERAAAVFVDSPEVAPRKQRVGVGAEAGTVTAQEILAGMMGDAPLCDICGHITVRNGSCFKCLNCGNSLGCS